MRMLPPLFDDEPQTSALPTGGALPPLFDDEPVQPQVQTQAPAPAPQLPPLFDDEPQTPQEQQAAALGVPIPRAEKPLPPLFDDVEPVRKAADDDGQRHGWNWVDDLLVGMRAVPDAWMNWVPGLNPMIITDYEAAPAPTAGGKLGEYLDFGQDLVSGFGTGALGALVGGAPGMGVAGGADQLLRNIEEKRIESIRKRQAVNPEVDIDTADTAGHMAGEHKTDVGDWVDAALAGVFNYGGGKLTQGVMTKAAQKAFAGKSPLKSMLGTLPAQAAYDAITGAAQGFSSEVNRRNATPMEAIRMLGDGDTWKNALRDGAISAAVSAGGQAATARGDMKMLSSARDAGEAMRAQGQETPVGGFDVPERTNPIRDFIPQDINVPTADLSGVAGRSMDKVRDIMSSTGEATKTFTAKVGDKLSNLRQPKAEGAPEGVAPEAAPAPVEAVPASPVQREVITRDDGSIERVRGKEGVYAHPNETVEHNPIPVRYELRELDDVQPSHLPENGFAPNEKYPQQIQNRFYDTDENEQAKVKNAARVLSPSKLINEGQGADDGPPIIDPEGYALSGNGRTQILREARAVHPENFEAYKAKLAQEAGRFGFDPSDVQGMKNPVLVRVADLGDDPDFSKRALFGAKANDRVNQAQTPADVGSTLATSGKIPKEMVDSLMQSVDGNRLGEALSNREFLYPFRDAIADAMPREVGAMFDVDATGDLKINANGRDIVRSMLLHHAVGDRALTKYVTAEESGISGKLESALMPILQSHNHTADDWALGDDLRTALRMISENPRAKTAEEVISGSTGDFVRNQEVAGDVAGLNDKTKALIRLLKSPKKTALREALAEYNARALDQEGMFGDPDVLPGATLKGIADDLVGPVKEGSVAAEDGGDVVMAERGNPATPSDPKGSQRTNVQDDRHPTTPKPDNPAGETLFDREDRVSVSSKPRKPDYSGGTDFALAQRYNRAVRDGSPEAAEMHKALVARGVPVNPGEYVPENEIKRLLNKKSTLPKRSQQRPNEGFHAQTPESDTATVGPRFSGDDIATHPVEMPEVISLFKSILNDVPSVVKNLGARGAVKVPRGANKDMAGVKAFMDAMVAGDTLEATRTLAHELFHIVDYAGGHAHTMARGGVARRMLADSKTIVNAMGEMVYKYKRLDPRYGEKKLRDELWELSKAMRPIDESTASNADLNYRKNAKELYADFGSALIMNPKLAKEKAPAAYEAFFRFLDEKPEVRKAYEGLMDVLGLGRDNLNEVRLEGLAESFAKGKQARTELEAKVEADEKGDTSIKGLATKWFHDSRHDLNQFVENRLGIKKNSAEWARYKNIKDKSQGWGNQDSLMLGELARKVDSRLEQHNLSMDDIGSLMTLQHIMETRYRKDWETEELNALFNPRGITAEVADEMMGALRKKLGEERFQQLEIAAKDARDIVFDRAIEAAYKSGLISDERYKTFHDNRDSYARFSVIDYITERIGADLKQQIGTFRDVENPYGATAMQGAALLRWAQQNDFRRSVAEPALERGWPAAKKRTLIEHVEEGQKPVTKTIFEEPRPGEGKVVEFWKDGEKHGVIIPTAAANQLDNLRTDQIVTSSIQALAALNRPFRAMFTKYAPVFNYLTSWYRDIPESVRTLNIHGKVGRWEFTKDVLKELKGEMSWKEFSKAMLLQDADVSKSAPLLHAKGGMNEVIEQVINDAVLLPVNDSLIWSDGSYNVSDNVLKRFAETHGLVEPPKATKAQRMRQAADGIRLLRATANMIERLPQIGEALNTAQKLAGQKHLQKQGLDPEIVAQMTRDGIGNPNTKTKGSATSVLDQVFLYTNVIQKSMARNFEALRRNPKAFALGLLKTSVASSSAMALASTGLLGETLQDWVEGIPEFDRSNYNCIPVPPFVSVDQHGRKRSHYIRLPMDDFSRVAHGITWKAQRALIQKARGGDVDAEGMLTDMFAFGESLSPGFSPVIKIPKAVVELATGQNPHDDFRGGPAIDPDTFEAGGVEKYRAAFSYLLQQTGAHNFIKFNGGMPSIGGFDRVYRVSGRGWDEAEYEALQPERKEAARKRLESRKVWRDYMNSADSGVIDDAETQGTITKRQAQGLRRKTEQTPLERKSQGLSKEARARALDRVP